MYAAGIVRELLSLTIPDATTIPGYNSATNLQGDIIAILDADGNAVVEYTYDAWGNNYPITGTMSATLGHYNPLRYRGYVYDNETGLYYLQSRYYNPEIGRWVNADSVVSGVGGEITGNNLFAYCFNNPVNLDDQSGNWPKWVKDSVKWVAKNVVMPVVKTIQNVLAKTDVTYSRGVNISGTPSAVIGNAQAGISIDTKGNVALQASATGGFTGGDAGLSITTYQSVTSAPNIDKLNGVSYQIGGSALVPVEGVPVVVGGDLNIIPDSEKNDMYLGITTSSGLGLGTPGRECHVTWGSTTTLEASYFNIFSVVDDIYIKILEW